MEAFITVAAVILQLTAVHAEQYCQNTVHKYFSLSTSVNPRSGIQAFTSWPSELSGITEKFSSFPVDLSKIGGDLTGALTGKVTENLPERLTQNLVIGDEEDSKNQVQVILTIFFDNSIFCNEKIDLTEVFKNKYFFFL